MSEQAKLDYQELLKTSLREINLCIKIVKENDKETALLKLQFERDLITQLLD